MNFDSLISELQRFSVAAEALAAVGAELRLRQENLAGDPRVRALLGDVARAINPKLLDGITADQEAAALAFIQTIFRQTSELLENPARAAGWSIEDPTILQSQGQLSRLIVRGIDAMGKQRPDLGATLRRPGAFFDIGTGVGWLAIEAARSWPTLRIVGLDPWEPALTLAPKNLGKSGIAERVELRSQGVEQLEDVATFTLAWLPGPFIAAEILDCALERIRHALIPGGWLVFGLNIPQRCPLDAALTALRNVRSGGHPWTPQEVAHRLRAVDFERVETFSPALPVLFVVGQRPNDS